MNFHSQQVMTISKSVIETVEKSYEKCSTLAIITPERQCQWLHFGVFIVNLEHISQFSSSFIVDFEQLVAYWNWTINM